MVEWVEKTIEIDVANAVFIYLNEIKRNSISYLEIWIFVHHDCDHSNIW